MTEEQDNKLIDERLMEGASISNAYKHGRSHGLRAAKDVICERCQINCKPELKAGVWFHRNFHSRIEYTVCKSGPILDLLKKIDNEPK